MINHLKTLIFLKYNSKREIRRKFYEDEISCQYYLPNCRCKLYGGNIVFLKRNDIFDTGKCDNYVYKIVSQVINWGIDVSTIDFIVNYFQCFS